MPERLNVNLQILDELRKYFLAHPNERFCQGLRNIGVVETVREVGEGPTFSNEFYTESITTLLRISKRLEKL